MVLTSAKIVYNINRTSFSFSHHNRKAYNLRGGYVMSKDEVDGNVMAAFLGGFLLVVGLVSALVQFLIRLS